MQIGQLRQRTSLSPRLCIRRRKILCKQTPPHTRSIHDTQVQVSVSLCCIIMNSEF